MEPNMRIALLEDDPFQSEVIVQILSQSGHDVVTYTDGATLLRMLGRSSYDMLILDWHTPGMLGIDVLSVVRSRHKDVLPILFVTAEESEKGLVRALTQGADDYITKPFRIPELRARVDALLRRAYPIPYGRLPFDVGPFHFNPQRQQVTRGGGLPKQPLWQTSYDTIALPVSAFAAHAPCVLIFSKDWQISFDPRFNIVQASHRVSRQQALPMVRALLLLLR